MVEVGREERSRGIDPEDGRAFATRQGARLRDVPLEAGALAGVVAAVLAVGSAADAATPSDVQILPGAQSIENLAVATYGVALTLPLIGGASANTVVKAFVSETRAQHIEHGAAFAGAIGALKGRAETRPDPALLGVVNRARPTLSDPGAVVALTLELEEGAAETYVRSAAILTSAHARNTTASIIGIEAQHVALLRAVRTLLSSGSAADIALPPPSLPTAAGSTGFPNAFYSTTKARSAAEGAVR